MYPLDISSLLKIDDTLIVVGGGHGDDQDCPIGCSFIGLFNLNSKNFVWAKYLSNKAIVRGLVKDGNYIVAGIVGTRISNRGAILKLDLNGNLIWGRETNFGCNRNDNLSVIVEPDGYVILGMCNDRRPLIYKISFNGTTPTIIRGFDNIYRPYKLIKDNDGNYIFIGASDAAERSYLTKINPSGTILYSKQYLAYDDMRFYDIAIDLDGNYLISGSVKIGNTTYPMVVKINKSDGSVMWSGYWDGAPPNQEHNCIRLSWNRRGATQWIYCSS